MSTHPTAPARSGPADVEVVDVHWERIQLNVTLRASSTPAAGGLASAGLALRRRQRGPTLEALAPIHATPAPGERIARFNVFVGPHQQPLARGTWRLVLRRVDGTEVDVAVAPDAASAGWGRDFRHGRGTYRVTPSAADGRFDVRISTLRRTTPYAHHVIVRWWRRRVRGVRWFIFRASGAVMRLAPGRGHLVVFTSDSRAELGGNLKLVHDRMVDRGLDRRSQLRSILKPSIRSRRTMLDRLRLAWLMSRANVILLDDYQPVIRQIAPRGDLRIIQLWHAWGAFKTVGYSRIGKPGGPSPFSIVHKNYTYATVSSTHEIPFYAEAFGIPEARVVATGTPRMDEFLDPANQEEGRRRAHDAFPSVAGRRVILFAPTFRGANAKRATYPVEIIDLEALHALCTDLDATLILKLHPFTTSELDIPERLRDRILDATRLPINVNDVLLIADALVTDYSSLIFEFSALGRPMLFFAFDLDEYVATRDFYEPYADFVPGRIVRSFPELVDALRHGDYEQHKVAPFARRHLPDEPGSATDRIIDQLVVAP